MASLSAKFLQELKRSINQPNVIIELMLDGELKRFGFHGRNAVRQPDGSLRDESGNEMVETCPALKNISSLQNRIDPKSGFSTRGELSFTICGRENFKNLIKDRYLKNRRVIRKDGFLAPGFSYSDYATTFSGKITDWSRKGDELTIIASDDLVNASKKVPAEGSGSAEVVFYDSMNPVDILSDMLANRLGVALEQIDSNAMATERDRWLSGVRFHRALTEPRKADEFLNELQQETNSFLVHDGEKITFKVFAPPVPGNEVETYSDRFHILERSLAQKSGYRESFYNRVVVYYDHDESGDDGTDSFESAHIALDAASQDSAQWNESSTKIIKSRWIRTLSFSQPANATGVVICHASRNNGIGAGTLYFDADPVNGTTLQWKAPGSAPGDVVKISKDGKYELFDADRKKWIKVMVKASELPLANTLDNITLQPLNGQTYAESLAARILNRHRDPVTMVNFELDINNIAWQGSVIKPTDIKDLTTDEACEKGRSTYQKERFMLTSVRTDYASHKIAVEAISTKMNRSYAFIAAAGMPDYPLATEAQKEYGFIRQADPKYHIW